MIVKYKDIFSMGNGIIYQLKSFLPFELKDEELESLDTSFYIMYGERILTRKFMKMYDEDGLLSIQTFTNTIGNIKKNDWLTLYNYLLKNDDLIGYSERITEDRSGNDNRKNTVSAYDSDELINDTGQDNETKNKRDYTREIIDNKTLKDKLKGLKDSLMYDTIFTDVLSFIALKIY